MEECCAVYHDLNFVAFMLENLFLIYIFLFPFFQVYFQRVLSSKTAAGAECISYVAALGCFIMAVPPIAIGAIAKSTRKCYFQFPYSKEVT